MRTVPGVQQRESQQQNSGLKTGLCDWKSGWLAFCGFGLPGSLVRWLDEVASDGLTALIIYLCEVIV